MVLSTYNIISKEVGVTEEMKSKDAMENPVSDVSSAEEGMARTPILLRIAWQRVILDEAHSIKNHKSVTAMSVCRLRAMYRWALTGSCFTRALTPCSCTLTYFTYMYCTCRRW